MEKLIVAQRGGRLGGRLNSLVNALRVAEKTGLPFRYHWSVIQDRDYEINYVEELFTQRFLQENIDAEAFRHLRPDLRRLPHSPAFPLGALPERCEGKAGFLVNGTRAYVFPGEDPIQVRRELRESFHRLDFLPELKRAFEEIERRMEGQEAVALHIRRGDLRWPRFRWVAGSSKYRPTLLYAEYLRRRYAAGARESFLVFSDDPETVQELKRAFPDLRSQEDFFDPGRYSELQLAVLDMFMMMQCRQIVGPGISAFSNFAETLAGTALLPIAQAFDADELRNLIYGSLQERKVLLHEAEDRERIDFVMDVLSAFTLAEGVKDKRPWLEIVSLARGCDPESCSLEHVFAHIEKSNGRREEAYFHFKKAWRVAMQLPGGNADGWRQRYAYDAAEAAVEIYSSGVVPTFPIHPQRGRLLDEAVTFLESSVALKDSGGRLEMALVELFLIKGEIEKASAFLDAGKYLSEAAREFAFGRHFGRKLLRFEEVRRAAKKNLTAASKRDKSGDLVVALLRHLHRQDGDEEAASRLLKRWPTIDDRFPWIAKGLELSEPFSVEDESDGDDSN